MRSSEDFAAQAEAAFDWLEQRTDFDTAEDWRVGLQEAKASLATLPTRCIAADEDRFYQKKYPGTPLRVLLYRRGRNIWRLLFTAHEATADDPARPTSCFTSSATAHKSLSLNGLLLRKADDLHPPRAATIPGWSRPTAVFTITELSASVFIGRVYPRRIFKEKRRNRSKQAKLDAHSRKEMQFFPEPARTSETSYETTSYETTSYEYTYRHFHSRQGD